MDQRIIDVSAPIGTDMTTIHRSDQGRAAGWQLVDLRILTW